MNAARHVEAAAGRRRPRRQWGLAAAAAVGAWLMWPASASAHLRTGTIAVDDRASISGAGTSAYTAAIQQSDHTLRLTVTRGHVIVVLGYLGEPVVRLDATGVWVNAASPTALAAGLLRRVDAVSASAPRWRRRDRQRSVAWRDARVEQLPAGVAAATWSVPLLVDGHPAALRGRLQRYPAPSLVIWGLLLAGLLAFGGGTMVRRRLGLMRGGALGCAALCAVVCPVLALGFALDGEASPGTWIESFNEIVFVAVGLALLIRGQQALRAGAAIGLGLVSLAVGLLDSAVFVHPVVLSLLPAVLTRLLVVIAAGGGVVAIGLAGLGYADLLPAGLEALGAAGLERARR